MAEAPVAAAPARTARRVIVSLIGCPLGGFRLAVRPSRRTIPGGRPPTGRVPMTTTLAFLYLLPTVPAADPAKYARPELLVEPGALKPDEVRVLDVRGREKYDA